MPQQIAFSVLNLRFTCGRKEYLMKSYFMDNAEYSAQDVNHVFSQLMSAGAVIFTDTGDALSDFNSANANVTTEGVTLNENSCKIEKTESGYKICPGACFMPDGSMIEVTEEEEIEVPEGGGYVYFERDSAKNIISLKTGNSAENENSVILAFVESNGSVTDKRTFAQSRLSAQGNNISVTANFSGTVTRNKEVCLEVGFAGFKYLVYHHTSGDILIDLTREKTYVSLSNHSSVGNAYVRKSGSKLYFGTENGSDTFDLNFELR